jgi:hypothetical protein
MKLCKDCKHYASPTHPLSQMTGAPYYAHPMCSHPLAERSVVDGTLQTACIIARGAGQATDRSVCWPDAKLFEEAPPPEPPPEPKPAPVYAIPVEQSTSFWRRIFG